MVTFISGANSADLDFDGRTVGDARRQLGAALNIPAAARAKVNGVLEGDDYPLSTGDEVVFVKTTAEKGR